MFVGIDLGTSGVKAVLVDAEQRVVGEATAALEVSRPHPLWSEQEPAAWWRAVVAALGQLASSRPGGLAGVQALGLAGQMHGAVLLDAADRVLRPAILWNDGRSVAECAELVARRPDAVAITGNLVMPGFTAPKLLWVQRHELQIGRAVRRVLLPKDWLGLVLTGEAVTEPSDASGTSWFDTGARAWSRELLAVCGLDPAAMPRVVEGNTARGWLRPEAALELGLPTGIVVAAGAGDNAAGAIGAGVIGDGAALLSLGTSGVLFVAAQQHRPCPERAVHAYCHGLAGRWHQMAVILSAASCLEWLGHATGAQVATLLSEAQALDRDPRLFFLPFLSGERTPWNDPLLRGSFVGLSHETSRGDLARAVLEGVAFAFAEGQEALRAAGTPLRQIAVIGGGSRSYFWGRILASALDCPLDYVVEGGIGAAFGAARLARLAATGEDVEEICTAAKIDVRIEPDSEWVGLYAERRARVRDLIVETRGATASLLDLPGLD